MPLVPALKTQRQVDPKVWGQPGLEGLFQNSKGYTEKSHLKKTKQSKKIHTNKKLYFTKSENVKEMDTFLNTYHPPELNKVREAI